jgi:hypothetical protein
MINTRHTHSRELIAQLVGLRIIYVEVGIRTPIEFLATKQLKKKKDIPNNYLKKKL